MHEPNRRDHCRHAREHATPSRAPARHLPSATPLGLCLHSRQLKISHGHLSRNTQKYSKRLFCFTLECVPQRPGPIRSRQVAPSTLNPSETLTLNPRGHHKQGLYSEPPSTSRSLLTACPRERARGILGQDRGAFRERRGGTAPAESVQSTKP
jgi:hypothetical protein